MVTVHNSEQLGALVRSTRRERKLSQRRLAALAGVGPRFLSEFEGGKPTAELGKALRVLTTLQIDLQAAPLGEETTLAQALSALRANEAELKQRGIVHAGIFGSAARGEDRPDSDI